MSPHNLLTVGVLAVAVLGATACGSDTAAIRPPATDLSGAELYDVTCATCHGADREGVGTNPALDAATIERLGPDGLREVITDGKGGMQGLGEVLTATQVDLLVRELTAPP